MRRLPVLHLITELHAGGGQTALTALLAHRQRADLAPHVVCLYGGEGLAAQRIRALGVPVTDLRLNAPWRLDALWRLWQLLRGERPLILHAWLFHANLVGRIIGRLAGVQVVITSRRSVEIGGPRREWLNARTASLDDHVIAVCELARQREIIRTGTSPDKVTTILNGIAIGAEAAGGTARLRASFGVPPDAPLLGAVGRLYPPKGHSHLITAVAQLRPAWPALRLLLVGDGDLRAELEEQAKQLGLQDVVIFTGTRGDVPTLLPALDLFVLPSLWEGLPNAVLEAMAAGLPVVATDAGGTPEVVVTGETGLLVPPADPAALAAAIQQLLSDPAAAQALGRAGRRRVEMQFTVEQMVHKTEALYARLLAAKGQ